jgi:uracil-DNA glycosylase
MAVNQSWLDEIMSCSESALELLSRTEIADFVDTRWPLPRPFLGSGDIRLIIVGQDPTIAQEKNRRHMHTVLNLDKKRGMWTYLEQLCLRLELSLAENVYATNACKNFFVLQPKSIKDKYDIDVLAASAPVWLPVLKEELAAFPKAMVVSLGEPVLAMLVRKSFSRELKYYWGYDSQWKLGNKNNMQVVTADQSMIERPFHPFAHHQTWINRQGFYHLKFNEYLAYVRHYNSLKNLQ